MRRLISLAVFSVLSTWVLFVPIASYSKIGSAIAASASATTSTLIDEDNDNDGIPNAKDRE